MSLQYHNKNILIMTDQDNVNSPAKKLGIYIKKCNFDALTLLINYMDQNINSVNRKSCEVTYYIL